MQDAPPAGGFLLDNVFVGIKNFFKSHGSTLWIILIALMVGLWFFPLIENLLVRLLKRQQASSARSRKVNRNDEEIRRAREKQQQMLEEMNRENKELKKEKKDNREEHKKNLLNPALDGKPRTFYDESGPSSGPLTRGGGGGSYRPSNSMRRGPRRSGGGG